tara:strand:- start:627 stop:845 length:219 start_codon:yes stop_codon:yes gene_type:complete
MADLSLSAEQHAAIKVLINHLITGAESVFESDFSKIEEEYPDLYHALIEFQESWDSTIVKDSLDIWLEELDQ